MLGSGFIGTCDAAMVVTCANPQQQTTLWRGLTPMEKIETMKES